MESPDTDPAPRTEYQEISLGNETVSMILDPELPDAWIQSDITRPIKE